MRFRRHSEKADELRRVPLFRTLSDRELEMVGQHADEITTQAGEVLIREGENARELLIIVDGSARVEHKGQEISRLGPGEFIGEMGLIDGLPRSATVVTQEPSTILVIESRSFWPLVDSIPGLARKLMMTLSQRIRDLHEKYIE